MKVNMDDLGQYDEIGENNDGEHTKTIVVLEQTSEAAVDPEDINLPLGYELMDSGTIVCDHSKLSHSIDRGAKEIVTECNTCGKVQRKDLPTEI